MNDNLKERLTDMSVLASSRTPADALQYIEELEAEIADLKAKLATCKKYRDAYAECDRIATQAVRDLDAKLSESEALLAKAVEALRGWIEFANAEGMPVLLSDLEAAGLTSSEAATKEGGKDEWKCPINYTGCTKNCGSYGCGN